MSEAPQPALYKLYNIDNASAKLVLCIIEQL
jgi:hypothetical protein